MEGPPRFIADAGIQMGLKDFTIQNCDGTVALASDSAWHNRYSSALAPQPNEALADYSAFIATLPSVTVAQVHNVTLAHFACRLEVAAALETLSLSNALIQVSLTTREASIGALAISDSVSLVGRIVCQEAVITDGAMLRMNSELRCNRLNVENQAHQRSLQIESNGVRFNGDGNPILTASFFTSGTNIFLGDSAVFRVEGISNEGLGISGGTLQTAAGTVVGDLHAHDMDHDSSPSILDLGRHSAATDVSGIFRISSAREARVSGALPHGFIFDGLSSDAEKSLRGATIENVTVGREDSRARNLWEQLREASVVIPTLAAAGLFEFHRSPKSDLRSLNLIAAATREMANVASSRGAPGDIRTRANFSAYYMRELTASSRWERMILRAYRTIGYGERPWPAIRLWLVGAAVMATIFNFRYGLDVSLRGAGRALSNLIEWLLPTLSLLGYSKFEESGRASTGHDDQVWLAVRFLAHSILAIPFLTGVLALRNFIKVDRST